MPGESKIEWTNATWNPVTGCTQVSPGCDHCYALTFAERFRGVPNHPYEQGFDLKLWPARLDVPIRWQKPRRIFVNSMSDLFHADVPAIFIAKVFAVMEATPRHTYQILTKRPQRMQRLLSSDSFQADIEAAAEGLGLEWPICDWPAPNVWLGTSVETQEYTHRIDWLLKTPAAVRFLSCEPLLGELDLRKWIEPLECPEGCGCRWEMDADRSECGCDGPCCTGENWPIPSNRLHWIITGGESGPGFRPVDPDWVRSIRDQCQDAGVAYFHKQWGGRTSKAGGRELDGREWSEFPAVRS